MIKALIIPALTTGAFCAGFAVVVDLVTDALNMWQVIVIAGLSGFLGSMFASIVLGRTKLWP